MQRRTLAFLLALVLIFSMLPVTLVAAETTEAGYTVILQKAHNQTENALVVDIYLQATTAGQADVTGYQFTVTPGTDLNVVVADATGNNGLATNGTTNVYAYNPDIAPAIPVGTAKTLVATATVTGSALPATIAEAFALTELLVVTADGQFTPAMTTVADYADCGHGTATWAAATEADLAKGGSYYLTGDLTVAAAVEIAAEKETVLCLNGYTLTTAADRIFNVTGGKLTICDCNGGKIVPGTAQGGVADMTAGQLILEDVVIDGEGVTGTAQGGAVYVGADAKLTMNGCTVKNCTALEGSAVELLGEAVVTNTTFTGNHATNTANYKGGVFHVNGTGKLEMTGGAFTKNTGVGTATVLYIRGKGTHVKLTGVSITNNTLTSAYTKTDVPATTIVALGDHATIANTLELHDCTIANNTVKKTGVTNYGGMSGGVYFNKNSSLVIGGSTQFKNNTITNKNGTIVRDVVAQNNGTNVINLADQWIKLENVTGDAYVSVYFWTTLTEKTLNEYKVLSGAVGDAVIYDTNNNSSILGTDGAYTYAQHTHEDGYANVAGTQAWKPWSDGTSLPIESGYYYLTTDVNLTAAWDAPKDVKLCLNGHSIDGGNKVRLIAVGEEETLTVCDCEKSGQLTGGKNEWGPVAMVSGASASKNGGKLYLYDVKVTDNTGTYVGAINIGQNADGTQKTDGYLYMENVEFCNNTATGGNGVVRTRDAGTSDSAAQIVALNCSFHDNSVTGNGGAIYMSGKSTLTVTDSEFYRNTATQQGSAVYTTHNVKATLDGCQLYENSVGVASTVSVFSAAKLTLIDTSITGNTISEGSTSKNGAGLNFGEKTTVPTTLSGKVVIADNENGDIVFWTKAADTVNYPTVFHVNGLAEGSRVVVKSTNMDYGTDANNVIKLSTAEGAAQTTWCSNWILWEGQNVDYVDSNEDGTLDNFVFATEHIHTDAQGNKIAYTGITALPADAAALAALADENGNVHVYLKNDISRDAVYLVPGNMTICLNGYDITSSDARTLRLGQKDVITEYYTLTIDDCTATKTAGGQYISGGITNTSNKTTNGGLVMMTYGHLVMNNGKLYGVNYNGTGASAGFVLATYNASSVTMNGGEICDNHFVTSKTGSVMSGAVQIQGSGAMTFTNGAIRNNSVTVTATKPTATTGVNGSAFWTTGTGKMTIENFVFENNVSTSTGDGKISSFGTFYSSTTGALEMKNVVFKNNVVEATGAKSGSDTPTTRAGAAYLSGNRTVNLTNVDFENNYSTAHGGAVYILSSVKPVFTDCDFIGNTAGTYGGAISSSTNSLTVKFTNCVFKDNEAVANNGGAMYWYYLTKLEIYGCTFEGNTAGEYGGAMVLTGSGTANVATIGSAAAGNTFIGNSAKKQGGAIHTNGKAVVNITNGTFTKNTAKNVSAISVGGSNNVTVTDCTIRDNQANGYGALYGATDTVGLTLAGKLIVTDNEGGDLYFQKTTSTTQGDLAVDVSGLTAGSVIGVNMAADRCEAMPQFTMNGGAAQKDYFYPSNEKFVLGTKEVTDAETSTTTTELALYKHIENGVGYTTVQAAVEAAEAAGTGIKLQVEVTETLSVTSLSYLDLNGKSVAKVTVADGVELSLIDSTTNDYDCSDGYGTVTVEGAYKAYVEDTSSGSLKRYVVIADEDGKLSAHRVYLAITTKTLRPANGGVGFKAIFAGDEVVTNSGIVYGIELSGYADFNQVLAASFDTMEPGAQTSTPNQKTVVIYDAITAENTSRWDADMYGRPFITIGGQTIYGKEVTVNMKAMAANALASGDATIVAAVNEMMTKCGVSAN